jgi:hypothetical protein
MDSIFLGIAVALSIVYFVLSLLSLSHVSSEEKERGASWMMIFDPWWPFHGRSYNASGRSILISGRLLFPLLVASYVAWLFILWK